jgi:DNA-binding transcriptional MerR regulator
VGAKLHAVTPSRTYRIRMAAQLSGVPEGLIRAWERRYGLLNPARSASGYRSYSPEDVELLRRVKKLTDEGIAIGDAAKLAPSLREEIEHQERGPAAAPAGQGSFEGWNARVLAAADAFHQGDVEEVLDEALASFSPLIVYERLVVPALREVGQRWHDKRIGVAQEHLVTQVMLARFLGLLQTSRRRGRKLAICACLPEEDHELGLLGAALRLQQLGFQVTYLGARTPVDELVRAAAELHPDVVAISAVNDIEARALRAQLVRIEKQLSGSTRLMVGGAGADRHPDVCKSLGALVMPDAESWEAFARSEGLI